MKGLSKRASHKELSRFSVFKSERKFTFPHSFPFCFKYVPLKKLKFEKINFYEPISKVYELEKPINKKFQDRVIYLTSSFMYLNLIIDPFNLNQIFAHLSLLSNLLIQPFLYYLLLKLKKDSSHSIKFIYLVQNGQQVLIKTEDNSVYLIHILDFEEIKESTNGDIIYLKTNEKHFILNLNSKKIKFLNEEVLNAIKEGRLIQTHKSFSNYDRLTIQK